jgi:hypothetical protein
MKNAETRKQKAERRKKKHSRRGGEFASPRRRIHLLRRPLAVWSLIPLFDFCFLTSAF